MRSMAYALINLLGLLTLSFAQAHAESKTKSFELTKFSRISAGGNIQFEIVVGSAQEVSLSGSETVLSNLSVRVVEDTLEIERKVNSTWQWPWQSDDIKLKINVPTLASIDFSGAAKGEIRDISGKEFEVSVSGAADITLSGKVEELSIDLSGSGKIKAGGLEARRVIADVAGAGDVEVFATQLLDADVSGVGNLTFRGKPAIVKTDISGVGKIQPKG